MLDIEFIRERALNTSRVWHDPLYNYICTENGTRWWIASEKDEFEDQHLIKDATFVAHARDDVLALVEEVEALRLKIEAMKTVLKD